MQLKRTFAGLCIEDILKKLFLDFGEIFLVLRLPLSTAALLCGKPGRTKRLDRMSHGEFLMQLMAKLSRSRPIGKDQEHKNRN